MYLLVLSFFHVSMYMDNFLLQPNIIIYDSGAVERPKSEGANYEYETWVGLLPQKFDSLVVTMYQPLIIFYFNTTVAMRTGISSLIWKCYTVASQTNSTVSHTPHNSDTSNVHITYVLHADLITLAIPWVASILHH